MLTGPSGVGKSSLLNAMFPGLGLRVGEISESVNKGRHTTVGALMLPLPGDDGGYVIDTPGLREVGMWALAPERARPLFPGNPRAAAPDCRFADCRHVAEPDVRRARRGARRATSAAARYDSYLRLFGESSRPSADARAGCSPDDPRSPRHRDHLAQIGPRRGASSPAPRARRRRRGLRRSPR